MNEELRILQDRVERLAAGVGELSDRVARCLRVADRPQDALALARGVAETLTKRVLEDIGLSPPAMLDACLRALEEPRVISRGLVPAEIITLLHMVRVLGNKATHDAMRIEATGADVDLVLRSVLRVVEWYFGEFERGPKLNPLFKAGAAPPPLRTPQPPPAVRMPPLLISVPDPCGVRRKVFLFTDRLVGLGREKPSRDPRIHIVTRLLPCPGPAHTNWNANLENISQFHAQFWWQMGRVEVRDENSEKGVLLDGCPIGRGLWTLCSLANPAHLRLGPGGVELTVSEVSRTVEGESVSCVRLTRVGNWPFHEYLLVSRPAVTVGPDLDSVICFPGVAGRMVTLAAGEQGWGVRTHMGREEPITPSRFFEEPESGLSIRRVSEEDFLD